MENLAKDYNFKNATWSDLKEISKIEQEFFGGYSKAFNEEFIKSWYKHNPNMFFVVKNGQDKVVAFSILTPISEKLYDKLVKGEVGDLYDFNKSEVPRTMDSNYYYISDICITKEATKSRNVIFALLFGGSINFLLDKANYIMTLPVTKEGARLCKKLGFVEVSESLCDNKKYPICELQTNNENIKKFTRFAKVLHKKG